ncbi:hypothetical protein CROQUDRAFT_659743 [Cronartium quercuum f. sp. fusiforme G11]|uniref:Protein arginine N-methyltransferase n=1 Tax=Cronartium quercuum f. sp. fusiforme G11 TaxID=708437 RepID=A0A9P6NJI0_9BASI|nr:hypothetical protein CROQUDRAFT_659743 [Cronartium quercuum f. sp. fusiforme G11]
MSANTVEVPTPAVSQHWIEAASYLNRCPIILNLSQPELNRLLSLQTHLPPQAHPPTHPDYRAPLADSNPNTLALRSLVQSTLTNQPEYDGLSFPLSNRRWRSRWEKMCVDHSEAIPTQSSLDDIPDETAEQWRRDGGFLSSELNLICSEDTPRLLCIGADWLELDSPVEGIRFDCELALKQEVGFASYLGLSHLILPPIRHRNYVTDYGRAVCALLSLPTNVHLAMMVPINSPTAWEDWHTVRKLCDNNHRLSISLDLTGFSNTNSNFSRWVAEPVSFLYIPASTFISNANQYPVLSKSCQHFLKGLLKFKPTIILSQTTEGKHPNGGPLAYVQYIRFLEKKMPGPNAVERYADRYLDFLQAPLQPLAENLDSFIYEGFEKDPVKYERYEEAVFKALSDRPSTVTQVVAVCGAGRGPLVEASLVAARRAGRKVHLIAVEKNPNSYVTLQNRKLHEWGDQVELWHGDMREFKPSDPIDIIVSELLGSFGDNEVSPECLDGVIRWLAADGISIPANYTAFLAPMSSSKLHSKVKEIGKRETPYVVMAHAASLLGSVQEVWSFEHPRTDLVFGHETGVPITNFHNSRSAHLSFQIPSTAVCDGFAGYFRAVLYADVMIETLPESQMSKEMLSWFPIFFPFKEPIYVPAGSELEIHLWRLTDQASRKVWYEWSADVYLRTTSILEPNKSGSVSTNTLESGLWPDDFANAPSPRIAGTMMNTVLPVESKIKIGMATLHNACGREAAVKW